MSKNALLGLAAALCLVVAGVGVFFMTQPQPAQVSSAEPGVSVAPERIAAAQAQDAAPVSVTPGGVTPGGPVSTVPPLNAAAGAPTASASAPAALPPTGIQQPTPPARPPVGGGNVPAAGSVSRPSGSSGTSQAPTGQDRSWPSGTQTTYPPAAPPSQYEPPAPAPQPAPPAQYDPPAPPPAPVVREPDFEELVVSQDQVLGLKLDSTVNSETARVEDPVEAHVTRDVKVGSRVAIPSGSRVLGSVTLVEQGGKAKTKARVSVRFHTLVLGDGTRAQIHTDAILREGESPGQEAAAKVGAAAAGGAILGAILGGGKGAAIGGSIGAAGGAAAVAAGKRNPAILQAGSSFTVRLLEPVTITVER